MKIVRVNATQDIELYDQFINLVIHGMDGDEFITIDKRELGGITKIDIKEIRMLNSAVTTEINAGLKIIEPCGIERLRLEFMNKEDRDLVYEELKKDILNKTK